MHLHRERLPELGSGWQLQAPAPLPLWRPLARPAVHSLRCCQTRCQHLERRDTYRWYASGEELAAVPCDVEAVVVAAQGNHLVRQSSSYKLTYRGKAIMQHVECTAACLSAGPAGGWGGAAAYPTLESPS